MMNTDMDRVMLARKKNPTDQFVPRVLAPSDSSQWSGASGSFLLLNTATPIAPPTVGTRLKSFNQPWIELSDKKKRRRKEWWTKRMLSIMHKCLPSVHNRFLFPTDHSSSNRPQPSCCRIGGSPSHSLWHVTIPGVVFFCGKSPNPYLL